MRKLPWIPPVLAFAYAIAVVIAAWRAPDKGFQAFTGHRVARVERGGVAERAGLREGDVIVEIDGTPVASTLDYAARVLGRAAGDRVVIDVTRGGRPAAVTIPLGASPPPWSALVATLLAGILLVLGLVARIGRPGDPIATRFYRASLAYAVVYVGALSWTHLVVHPVLGVAFLAALFAAPKLSLDFALALAGSGGAPRRWSAAMGIVATVLGAGCAAALALAIANYRSGDGALRWVVVAVAVQIALLPAHTAIALAFQIRAHRVAHGARRAQLRWLMFGQALGAVPALGALPFAAVDLDRFLIAGYQPFVVAIAAIWFISCGIAVLQIRLADVDALIESSLGYTIATGATVVVYAGVVLAAGELTEWLVGEAEPWPHLVAAIAAAAAFGPLRARVGGWLDRRFFRDRAHYIEALRRAGESLARLREPAELARVAVEQVVAAVHADAGALYVATGGSWTVAYAVGGIALAEPSAGGGVGAPPAPRDGVAVAVDGLPAAARDGVAVAVGALPAAARDGVAVAVGALPAAARDGVAVAVGSPPAAMLVLGPRRSGDLYSSHDRNMLAALASQLAAALANASSFGTIAELSRTLAGQNAEIRGLRDRLEDENRLLRARVEAATEGATLAGESHAIRELRRTAELVAKSDASVLVLGESGTGKGLLARLIHAWSPRAAGPFLRVDCGAIAAGVFESELFGHERGAFTGATRLRRGPIELADGGTLVLDEIGELPLELQPKLLRVLEDHAVLRVGATAPIPVDVRVIAATNRDLAAMVARNELREDLYFRLRVVELVAPPLRNRIVDLPALCEQLLPRVARRCGRAAKPVAPDALERLAAYRWPGNVRELQNVLERALVLGDAPAITAADLDLPELAPLPELAVAPTAAPHGEVMEDIERRRLTNALRAAAGNQSTAARALGMPRTTLINKLRRYGLL